MAQHPTISKMETVQTAVEWLREQYVHITWMVNRGELSTDTAFLLMLKRFD